MNAHRLALSLLMALGGAWFAPSEGFAQDSLLLRSYDFVRRQDAWLTGPNAAGLTRLTAGRIADAQLSLTHAEGGLTDYYQSPRTLQAAAAVESFCRLSHRTVVYGRMAYDNYSGRDMAGSAFIDPTRKPFDIVEDSLTNTGRKHRDTYQLSGALSVALWRGIALGARLDYTSANIAKYKDLRHKNKLMDLSLTAGVYLPVGRAVVGANYYYRRNTESLQFSTYGTSDRIYKSLISYANFMGRVEQFGANGYTDQSREMPLLDEYQGLGVQLDCPLAGALSLYQSLTVAWREGYYGRKSPWTITYTGHDARVYDYQARLSYSRGRAQHRLDVALTAENLQNRANTYQELTNESGAYYYEYYQPVKTANKLWVNTAFAYTADLGIRREQPLLTLAAAVSLMHRRQTAYVYPYLRRQKLDNTECSLRAERHVALRRSLLSVSLSAAFLSGSGEPYQDDTLLPPSDVQSAPDEMAAWLYREYRWLTAPQYTLGAAVRYSFVFPRTRLKTYLQASASHRKANQANDYTLGSDRTTLQLVVGTTF